MFGIIIIFAIIILICNGMSFASKQKALETSVKADRVKFSQQQEIEHLHEQIKLMKQQQQRTVGTLDNDPEIIAARKAAMLSKIKAQKLYSDERIAQTRRAKKARLQQTKLRINKVAP